MQTYQPLDIENGAARGSLTVGQFFQATDIKVYFDRDLKIFNCSSFNQFIQFYTLNPPLNVSYTSQFDYKQLKCVADVDPAMLNIVENLLNNFTIHFQCSECSSGY